MSKPRAGSRPKNLVIRLSDAEKGDIEEVAGLMGVRYSVWARIKLREAAIKELLSIGRQPRVLGED